MIKLDVQGYEDKVKLGGTNIFWKVDVVITELTFVELYDGQVMFGDVYSLLISHGLEFRGINQLDILVDPSNGMP
jgi:hypothetical protein